MLIWQYLLVFSVICELMSLSAFLYLNRASDQNRFHQAMIVMGLDGIATVSLLCSVVAALVHYTGK